MAAIASTCSVVFVYIVWVVIIFPTTHATASFADSTTDVTPFANTTARVERQLPYTESPVTHLADKTTSTTTPLTDKLTTVRVTPFADSTTDVTPLANTTVRVAPFADSTTDVTPLANTTVRVATFANSTTTATPMANTTVRVVQKHNTQLADKTTSTTTPLTDKISPATNMADIPATTTPFTHLASKAIFTKPPGVTPNPTTPQDEPTNPTSPSDGAMPPTSLPDYKTNSQSPQVDTSILTSPLDDVTLHTTPLDNIPIPSTPLDDSTIPTTPLDNKTIPTTPLVDTLKTLIAKQFTLCGYTSLCTIGSNVVPTGHLACCDPCSCNPDCSKKGNCCVDYALKVIFGNLTFPSLSTLQVAMTDIKTAPAIEALLDDMYMQINNPTTLEPNDISTHGTDGTDVVSCRSHQMTHMHRHLRTSKYYKVLMGCTKNTKDGINSVDGCVEVNRESEGFFDKIPVTSRRSGKTYINSSVLGCCGDADEPFEYWDMFMVCDSAIEFIPNYVLHPLALLDRANVDTDCVIVFEPNENMRKLGLVPKECRYVGKNTCANKQTSKRHLFLKHVCGSEMHAVNIVHGTSYTFINNVACAFCISEDYTVYRACKRANESDGVMKLRVNLNDAPRHQGAVAELSDGGLLDTQALPSVSRFIGKCSVGHIFVTVLGECKQLYCPRSMYIVNGSCVPLYDHVTGVSYKTTFNMTIISPVTTDFNISSFEREFVTFLNKEHFRNASLTIDRVRIRILGYTYMVEMLLSPTGVTDTTLTDVVKAVTRLYFTTVDIQLPGSNNDVQIGISPGISTYFKTNKHLRTNGADTIDIKDVTEPHNNTRQTFEYVIEISESYTCYRIALRSAFIKYLHKYAIAISVINATVHRENMDFRPGYEELLFCADLFLNKPRYFHVNLKSSIDSDVFKRFKDKDKPATSIDDEKEKFTLLIVIIGVVGTVLCVVARLSAGKVSACLSRPGTEENN